MSGTLHPADAPNPFLTVDHRVTLTDEDHTQVHAEMSNVGVLALNKFLRGLPPQERGFFKDCKIVAILPAYLPAGEFNSDEIALNLDREQLDWFLKRNPEFLASDEGRNNTTQTGEKLFSFGGIQ